MTLQELSKQYRQLHQDIKENFSFEEYVKTYGSIAEFKELLQLEDAMQLYAETNCEEV